MELQTLAKGDHMKWIQAELAKTRANSLMKCKAGDHTYCTDAYMCANVDKDYCDELQNLFLKKLIKKAKKHGGKVVNEAEKAIKTAHEV